MEKRGEAAVTIPATHEALLDSRATSKDDQFRKLVLEHQEMVLNTCFRFVFNREDAEDLAQDVFVEVYRSLDQFREESKLSTWIYRIAVTKSLDYLRRLKRKKRFSSLKRVIGIEDPSEDLPDTAGSNPLQSLAGKENANLLLDALNALPENQKTAFLLSKQDGYSNQEIADILQSSVSAVESLIHRAKKNLHDKLYKHFKQT
ncbi:RNA polymerase sigma factor [Chlorobium phaeobacteroides]|jgi:RNA polymerase sigma-70 factor (ECF subfamily)|uniref:RNA polymerase sigma factor n=1 Tax=Chlorobium phaeobacteroides (strain DSM 266 / SMG 266 / 2430) TaxID=290317 RepID=A1BDJ0_CHLPD|nr:RNA polymerase sigma factor [Chlorobium phaeobacteroides]ABL64467.1 RNA polymerase, sigma subunit, ECF family [Chlorobium phaeobacteroides DSM 266]MBV5319766.1 RNA polymerase sigma factor [Chlorobium phaeobacteroides]